MSYIVAACEKCKTVVFDPEPIEEGDPRLVDLPKLSRGFFYADCRVCAAYDRSSQSIQQFYQINALSDL